MLFSCLPFSEEEEVRSQPLPLLLVLVLIQEVLRKDPDCLTFSPSLAHTADATEVSNLFLFPHLLSLLQPDPQAALVLHAVYAEWLMDQQYRN